MIMNYVLSFCRITAASRIFSRNFYLPLLKPLTPKDALRTFKITGKWLLGSKIHHYIPVLFNHKKKRSRRSKYYGKTVHKQNSSYTYMSPRLDESNESHRVLKEVLDGMAKKRGGEGAPKKKKKVAALSEKPLNKTKSEDDTKNNVEKEVQKESGGISEKIAGYIFTNGPIYGTNLNTAPKPLAKAFKNEPKEDYSDIIDEDKWFVYTVEDKMCNIVFPGLYEVAIRDGDIIDILVSQSHDKILIKLKNFKKISVELEYYEHDRILYRGEGATSEEEEKFHHHGKMIMSLAKIFEAKELAEEWEMEMMKIVSRKKRQKGEGTQEWNEMVNKSIQNLDWQKFELDAKKVIDQIWEPAREEHIPMEVEDLDNTRNCNGFILQNNLLPELPLMSEIPEIIKNMSSSVYHEYADPNNPDKKLSGVKLTLASGKTVFITGQMVKTDEGEVFVPGQTVENDFGVSYAPGFTINMDGAPQLIKGLIMGEDNSSSDKAMFVPTESSITKDGELTFCRNPEEKVKAKPQKIFVKRHKAASTEGDGEGKKRKAKKKKVVKQDHPETIAEEPEVTTTSPEPTQEEPSSTGVLVEEPAVLGIIVCVENDETNSTASLRSEEELSIDDFQKGSQDDISLDGYQKRSDCGDSSVEEYQKGSQDDDTYKPLDDGMDRLIENLEDKKCELWEKLEELRKLKIAPLENAVSFVGVEDAEDVAKKLIGENDVRVHKLAAVLLTMTRKASTIRERYNVNILNINNPSIIEEDTFITEADEKYQAAGEALKTALKSALYAANEVFKTRPKDQLLAISTMGDILKSSVKNEKILDALCLLMNTKLDRNEICTSVLKELMQRIHENKLEVLKFATNCSDSDVIIEKIEEILNHDDLLVNSLKKLCKGTEELPQVIMEHVKSTITQLHTEIAAKDSLHASIVQVIKDYAEESLLDLENYSETTDIKDFLSEAAGLASTLGLYEVSENLLGLESVLTGTKSSTDFLKRFMLIKKLCERDYSIKTSLQRIKKHPEAGRTDPRIRTLLLQSSALLTTPNNRPLRNSLEIPLRLFQEQNFLAIEDQINQKTKLTTPILISRKGIQAVVPKEQVRNVLAGRVSYVLIDESGVTNFKPMHMFRALKLGKSREDKFQDFAALGGHERRTSLATLPSQSSRTSPSSDVRKRLRKMSLNNARMTA